MQTDEIVLKLNEFRHNIIPVREKLLAKFIRPGIRYQLRQRGKSGYSSCKISLYPITRAGNNGIAAGYFSV
jgi:hypothetical protein